jgi:hypothetical protein
MKITLMMIIVLLLFNIRKSIEFTFPSDIEQLTDAVAIAIMIAKKSDCTFNETSFHHRFTVRSVDDVITSDSCYLSREAKHTEWNERNHSFTIDCKLPDQIALYNLGPYDFDFNQYQNQWQYYPSNSYIVNILKQSDIPIPVPPISMKDAEIVQTVCVDLEHKYSYHDYYANIIRDNTLVSYRKQLISGQKPVDIRVIVLDCVGREYFYRQFPNTHQYIRKLMNQPFKTFDVYEQKQLHVVGYNTIGNMLSLVTGNSTTLEFNSLLLECVENGKPLPVKLIWEYLQEYGYVTTIGEDAIETELDGIYGLGRNPRTYDTYPSYDKISDLVQCYFAGWFTFVKEKCPCVGNKFIGEIMFNWAQRHSLVYSEIPNFIVTVHNDAHDVVGSKSRALDLELMYHLQWYVETGRVNNTAILLVSDHGLHYGQGYHEEKYRSTAFSEHENPVLFWFLPNNLATKEFKGNINKLVTMKDLHMTLRDIASFPKRSTTFHVRNDAQSLLYDKLPQDRNCMDANVPYPYIYTCSDYSEYQHDPSIIDRRFT